MNFYVDLTESEAQTAAITFQWTVKGTENIVIVDMKDAEKKSIGYKASCPIAVAEMTYPITATLTVGDEEVETNTYSAVDYADVILTNAEFISDYTAEYGAEKYQQLAELVKSMLDYGAKAQVKFNRTEVDLANAKLTAENPQSAYYYKPSDVTSDMIGTGASDMSAGLSACGLEYTGSTVVFLSKTSLRHYYRIAEPDDFALIADYITFNGANIGYQTKGNEIYFELKNIEAANLDERYILNINGTAYSYSALDYVKACLSSDAIEADMKALAKATFLYNQAANAYFG